MLKLPFLWSQANSEACCFLSEKLKHVSSPRTPLVWTVESFSQQINLSDCWLFWRGEKKATFCDRVPFVSLQAQQSVFHWTEVLVLPPQHFSLIMIKDSNLIRHKSCSSKHMKIKGLTLEAKCQTCDFSITTVDNKPLKHWQMKICFFLRFALVSLEKLIKETHNHVYFV